MWSICRVDTDAYTNKVSYFEIQAAYRKRDLDIEKARQSGFVGPNDKLVIVTPDGRILN